jgi:histidyl-tRNA synthetase
MSTQAKPSNSLKAVRGTRDLLPPETALWNRVESIARGVFARYGFGEIRTPIFEDTQLFARGVGEETDIVSKEMYTWSDGERFDKEQLRDWWLRKNDERLGSYEGAEAPFDLLVETHGGPNELVVFSQHSGAEQLAKFAAIEAPRFPRPEDFDAWLKTEGPSELQRLQDPQRKLKATKRLVVASPIPNKAEEWIDEDFVVEYAFGNFSKSSQSLTLRPENTAGVVRAYIEHKLGERGDLQKLFYIGPQFRRERPQRGRYRQFWQIGVEVLGPVSSGSESPLRDAEVLEMLATLLDELGVRGWQLQLNSVGSSEDRKRYNVALREALAPVKAQMCEDNQRRAETNPLRVLDSKEPADQEIINALPKIADFLDESSRAHFAGVLAALDACGVAYTVNPRLVRGLDYYTRTTFEFTVPDGSGLGTQNALLGGGRYDGLSEMLGGPKAPGIGFAIGEDRLILILQEQAEREAADRAAAEQAGVPHSSQSHRDGWVPKLDAYIAPMGAERNAAALSLARELRRAGLSAEVGDGTFRLKKSFEAADKVARHIVILGEDEVASGTVKVKNFASGQQVTIPQAELIAVLKA